MARNAPASTSDSASPAESDATLDEWLSRPDPALSLLLAALPGDVVVLGAGGKMGPSLARMYRRALDAAGGEASRRRVIAVSRFGGGEPTATERQLADAGVETVRADLTDRAALAALPDAANVIFMAGQKFGTRGQPSLTWAMNAYLPALCAERYAGARGAGLLHRQRLPAHPCRGPGASESTSPSPLGEYAMSCLGRERLWEYLASRDGTRVAVVRLNYANALRYGVLTDIARRVWRARADRRDHGRRERDLAG